MSTNLASNRGFSRSHNLMASLNYTKDRPYTTKNVEYIADIISYTPTMIPVRTTAIKVKFHCIAVVLQLYCTCADRLKIKVLQ